MRAKRKERRWTASDAATYAGLTQSHIFSIEAGVGMSVESLSAYCRALDVSIDEILAVGEGT